MKQEHFIYNVLEEIVDQRDLSHYRIKHTLDCVLFSILAIRMLLTSIAYHLDSDSFPYNNLDPLGFSIEHIYGRLSLNFSMIILLLALLGLLGKIIFYFTDVNTWTFRLPYQINVQSWDHLKRFEHPEHVQKSILQKIFSEKVRRWQSKRIDPTSNWLLKSICWQWTKFQFNIDLENIDKRNVRKHPMENETFDISAECLFKLAKMNMIADYLMVIIKIVQGLGCSFLFYEYYKVSMQLFASRFWHHFLLLVDIINLIKNMSTLLKLASIFSIMSMSTQLCKCYMLERYNRLMESVSIHCKRLTLIKFHIRARWMPLNARIASQLNHICRQHGMICYETLAAYQGPIGNAILIYLGLSVPMNVLNVSTLMMEQLNQNETIGFVVIILGHTSITSIILFLFAKQSKLMHRIKDHLVPVIQAIDTRNKLWLKLKFDDMFNRLVSGKKYGPSLAHTGAITYSFIFNITLIYVGLFLYFFGHIRYL